MSCASKRIAAPETSGRRACTQARLIALRVAKLSVQSSTTSALRASGEKSSMRFSSAMTSTSGLMPPSAQRAASTFGFPTESVR